MCQGYDYECEYENGSSKLRPKRPPSPEEFPSRPPEKLARLASPQSVLRRTTDASIPGIVEPSKARYVGKYSSIAFPLYVGLEVQAPKLPRLHSFAYHSGIRKEPPCAVTHQIAEKIPWNTTKSLIEIYIVTVHPIFGFLDMDNFSARCEKHWHGQPQDLTFEATASGVLALASLLNGNLDQDVEMWLVLHAKQILEDHSISRFPSLEQIAAWILRAVYLRCTGRPHVTWLTTCTMMHLIEANGLHHSSDSLSQTTGNLAPSPEVSNTNIRTAQVATCLHIVIAFEYGRSIMTVNRKTFEGTLQATHDGDLTPQMCSLVAAALPVTLATQDSADMTEVILSALEKVVNVPVSHDFLLLLKADLALGIYRRLRVMDPRPQQMPNDRVISTGAAALPAARRLMSQGQVWWNIIGSIFQFTCALLVMDTSSSFDMLLETMDTLEFVVDQLDTHLAREALSTARQLARAALDKKKKSIEALERVVGASTDSTAAQRELSQSPTLDHQFPFDLDSLWAMEFQLPL
ncbi:Protein RDR1 [Penicillium rolfsii]|nr:Protein RDR1 [Penicillium rolfsii]